MRLLADAGVAFGVMTTLTAYNAAEFAQVAAVASDAGAGRASPFSVVLALVLAAASWMGASAVDARLSHQRQ